MHPDVTIAALRQELERLHPDTEDYADRKTAIEREIELTDALPRPVVSPEQPDVVVDHRRVYLDALKDEYARTPEDRRDEVKAEIKRVAAELRGHREDDAMSDDTVSQDEIEQRKQARTNRKVEQARNAPVPEATPAVSAPVGAGE